MLHLLLGRHWLVRLPVDFVYQANASYYTTWMRHPHLGTTEQVQRFRSLLFTMQQPLWLTYTLPPGSSKRLEDFTYSDGDMADLITESIQEVDFIGVSGHIKFTDNGATQPNIVIEQQQGWSPYVIHIHPSLLLTATQPNIVIEQQQGWSPYALLYNVHSREAIHPSLLLT